MCPRRGLRRVDRKADCLGIFQVGLDCCDDHADLNNDTAPLFRFSIDTGTAERDLTRLVLTLVELVRRLTEAQALRRMRAGTVTEEEVERLGQALMGIRNAVTLLCQTLGLAPEELNIDLGPLGRFL